MSERLASPLSFAPIQRQFYERPEFKSFEQALGKAGHQAIKAYVLLWDHAIGSNPREDGAFNVPTDVQLKAICRWRGSVKGLRTAIQTELNSSPIPGQWRLKCWEFDAARAVKARAGSARRMARKRISDSESPDVTRNVTPKCAERYADKDQVKDKEQVQDPARRAQQAASEDPSHDESIPAQEAARFGTLRVGGDGDCRSHRQQPACDAREQARDGHVVRFPDLPMPGVSMTSTRDSSLASSNTLHPQFQLPRSIDGDLTPLGFGEAVAAICDADPRLGSRHTIPPRWQAVIEKLAGKVTRRDIAIAVLKWRAKVMGESVAGQVRNSFGLMVCMVDETTSNRVNAQLREKGDQIVSEVRMAERHESRQAAFEQSGGGTDYIQAAIDGRLN